MTQLDKIQLMLEQVLNNQIMLASNDVHIAACLRTTAHNDTREALIELVKETNKVLGQVKCQG